VVRTEIIGREGGKPPILLLFEDVDTNETLGVYLRYSLDSSSVTYGPMFG
jgi:hypothetical protein